METTLHTYRFDCSKPEEAKIWDGLHVRLGAGGMPKCMGPVYGNYYDAFRHLNGQPIELDTRFLFDNQWNTPTLRVFDWVLEAVENQYIKQGHYLDQTPEMAEIRRNTVKCGYCGHQEPAATSTIFCSHCLDSKYLTEDYVLKGATRMQAINSGKAWTPLSDAEKAHLLPAFIEAQIHGSTDRGKARIAKLRESIAEKRDAAINHANTEYHGMLWLLDRGITASVIYYNHTGRFGFGWRSPLGEAEKSKLLDVLVEFPFDYDIA